MWKKTTINKLAKNKTKIEKQKKNRNVIFISVLYFACNPVFTLVLKNCNMA